MGSKFALAPRTSKKSPFLMGNLGAYLENSRYLSFKKCHVRWLKESFIVPDFNKADLSLAEKKASQSVRNHQTLLLKVQPSR